MAASTDRIEKRVLLRAPLARVWRAVSDAGEFGRWFGVRLEGPFVAGERLSGRIVPTEVDAHVAKMQEPYTGLPFDIVVERIEPMRLFSFRWHPSAVDRGADYSREPMTLVEFVLEEAPGGTMLTITESGFDSLPPERRAEAYRGNEGGWEAQLTLVGKYLALYAGAGAEAEAEA